MTNKPKLEVWAIRHKETKEIWEARSGKSSWKAKNHAKSAWANTHVNNEYALEEAGIPPELDEWSPPNTLADCSMTSYSAGLNKAAVGIRNLLKGLE